MSESESFIQEVTDEVRRDRLFALFRRYGWVAVTVVVLLVAGAAWNEWRKAQAEARAQAFGDSVTAALEQEDPEARLAALEAIATDGAQGDVLTLLRAAERVASGDRTAAADVLRPLAASTSAPAVYGDLAALKLVLLGEDGADAATRSQLLDRLARPGAPYRLIALENQALELAAAGETAAARLAARAVLQEPDLTQNTVQRLVQLLQALGPDPEDSAFGGADPAAADPAAADPAAADPAAADPAAADPVTAPGTVPDASLGSGPEVAPGSGPEVGPVEEKG